MPTAYKMPEALCALLDELTATPVHPMTRFAYLTRGLTCATAYALLATVAPAESLFDYNPLQLQTSRVDGPYVIGNLFRVDVPNLSLTHLGIQDVDAASDPQDPDGADSMTGYADDDGFFRNNPAPFGPAGAPLEVGLWTADGLTLLASTTVSSTDPVTGSYRYALLGSPVALTSGASYLIGAVVGGGIEWFLDNGAGTPAYTAGAGITLLESRFTSGGTLAAPLNNADTGGSPGRWAAANAQLTVVPEPSVALLGIVGAAGIVLRRRRSC